ncbi:hypothetical protein ST398NM02_2843 [Staphylococcus aureus subsp. aureus DR10]|uniref:Uncharacterized protein n=1 Tax=Staphylococcus aureus subsp. aureus DR10 TaxID=1155079 RepID=A0ABC9Q184_STAA5|nr:hypothetical protein ST398NM01_2843 [Staphylococcus aureus subsp. aureus 71193]AFR72854.1 hypothetical protein C248_0860 [Staphylococcus aureus 08BA02176]EIA14360.1 hypothetical protein ST398NM02_2843 [Staphylococcus aureus subsp. aureus DR10]
MCKTLHDTNEGKNLTPFSSGPVRLSCGSFSFISYSRYTSIQSINFLNKFKNR